MPQTIQQSGWQYISIGELVKEGILFAPIDGNHGEIHPKSVDFVRNGVPFIMASDLKGGNVDSTSCKFISFELARTLRKGFSINEDVLLSHKATIGRTAIVNTKYEFIVLTPQVTYYRIRDKAKLDNIFLRYYFDSPFFQNTLLQHAGGGSTRDYIGITKQLDLPIILPPLSEQRAIAAVLSSFDGKIDLLRKQNKTLEEMAQTLFKEWFVDFNFPNEKGKPYKKFGGKMVESELGEVPEGWEVKQIDDFVEIRGGGTPSTKNDDFWNGEISWTSPKDLSNSKEVFLLETESKITEEGLKKISSGLLPIGTLLLSSRAPIGYLALTSIPVAINQGYIAFLPDAHFSNFFMYLWLKQNMGRIVNAANGSTFLEISKTSFRRIQCIVPDKGTLRVFNDVISPIFSKIHINIYQIQTLSSLRDQLLPRLMRGECLIKFN